MRSRKNTTMERIRDMNEEGNCPSRTSKKVNRTTQFFIWNNRIELIIVYMRIRLSESAMGDRWRANVDPSHPLACRGRYTATHKTQLRLHHRQDPENGLIGSRLRKGATRSCGRPIYVSITIFFRSINPLLFVEMQKYITPS
jgi:hypothetical protein